MTGVGGRDRRGTTKGKPPAIGNAHHCRCCSHGHAGPVTARDTALDPVPLFLVDVSCAPLVPVFPDICPRPKLFAGVIAPQHGTGGKINEWKPHADSPHHEGRCGFVAPPHQDCPINGMRAQCFFDLDCAHISIKHGGRF